MIPVIDVAGQPRENHLHETLYPDAGLAQPADVLAPESPTAHVVVDQPHLDPLLRLGDQNVGDLAAQRIVLDDVIFQMDRRTGRPQRLADFVERLRSVVPQLHPVMHRQQRLVAVEQQRNDIAVVADLRFVQHRGVVDLVDLLPAQRVDLFEIAQFLAAEQFLLAVVAPENDVKDKSDDRQQRNHDDPRQRLHRIALVVNDHGDRDNHENDVPETQVRLQVDQGEK